MRNKNRPLRFSIGIIILIAGSFFAIWSWYGFSVAPLAHFLNAHSSATQTSQNPAISPSVRVLPVPILIYHSIAPYRPGMASSVLEYTLPPESLDRELAYLKNNGYSVVTFDSLIDAMINPSSTLPSKPIVLTFDDAWEDQYRDAFPILKKYHDTATFFVFTNAMDSSNSNFMTWDQLKEMQDAGMSIESHSVSHPYLTRITDIRALTREIVESKTLIKEHLGTTPDIFAYPFGRYNNLEISVLQSAGYRAARADLGWPRSGLQTPHDVNALYELNGIQVTNDFQRFLMSIQAIKSNL